MRELRIQSHGDQLIGGNKTCQEKRFYKKMIPKADALYDEHLNILQSHSTR